VHTPEPTPIRPRSFSDRFWTLAAGPDRPDVDDVPEPLRTVIVVRHFLAVLDRLDLGPRAAAPSLVSLLRQAELDGDLSYASPEQLRGEILDTRSVVFSLGVVLFERLTGRHPFGAENNRPRRIDRIRRGELGSGVNSFPTVAAGLRTVLVRAMSPFSEERWPDLRQVRELLAQFVVQESPPPRLPGTSDGDVEETKVVRLATEFGRELMQAVARHDRAVTPRPPIPPGLIPTAGVGAVTGGAGARRAPLGTPRSGVVSLRPTPPPPPNPPPEPSSDSVVTRVRDGGIDPLAATLQLVVDDLDLARRADDGLDDVIEPPPPIEPPREPPAAPPITIARRRRTAVIAAASAVGGAVVAILAASLLRSSPAPVVATASSLASRPSAIRDEIRPPPPLPPAAAADPAEPTASIAPPVPARRSPRPAEAALAAAVAPCLAADAGVRIFGITIAFRGEAVHRRWFAGDQVLSATERGCITRAITGLTVRDAPAATAVYRFRSDGARVTVSPR
jgi:hypothetical protein